MRQQVKGAIRRRAATAGLAVAAATVAVLGAVGGCDRRDPTGQPAGATTSVRAAGTGATATTGSRTPATSPATIPATIPATNPATGVPAATNDEADVLEAFNGYWRTWDEANNPPDPDHPGLARYYTGPAYERAVRSITENRDRGIEFRLPQPTRSQHKPSEIQVSGDVASLDDCAVDDGIKILRATGSTIDSSIVTDLYRVTLVRSESVWKVSENVVVHEWEGVVPCDAQR